MKKSGFIDTFGYVYIHIVQFLIKIPKVINLFYGLLLSQTAAIPKATRNAELEIYSDTPMTQIQHFFSSVSFDLHI